MSQAKFRLITSPGHIYIQDACVSRLYMYLYVYILMHVCMHLCICMACGKRHVTLAYQQARDLSGVLTLFACSSTNLMYRSKQTAHLT
jgi:hypothetical protein